ncbi:nitroreductase family protein [Clostridium manihotivorum]|jgi:nitroreductase|uniref:Nitroreductase n=1 Tax=Clostridium manihotivorum TaxID=2320868 RepID=A0A3R5UIF1_9CLOT|nr:nitroreductase family protein [Clostridium manihotivorum]QAA34567.1 nitroreductase [Clostridium manihotivorum]
MGFYEVIEERQSIKSFNTQGPIEKDKLNRMINAAMMAPSWKNNTSYKIILVDDKKVKDTIADTVLNDDGQVSRGIKDAPLLAVFVAAPDKSGELDGKEYYLVDGAIAMEHFILAATAEGYSTCWVGAANEADVINIIGGPNNYKLVGMTPVGNSDEQKDHNPKKDYNDYVFLNRWDNSFVKNF